MCIRQLPMQSYHELEMWANAQRDGRPVEYRWRRGALCSTPQSLADAHYYR